MYDHFVIPLPMSSSNMFKQHVDGMYDPQSFRCLAGEILWGKQTRMNNMEPMTVTF